MTRKEYLKFVEGIYKATLGLIKLTPGDKLDFKPMDGLMTIGQVVKHLTDALGGSLSMAINKSWPQLPEGEMLPPLANKKAGPRNGAGLFVFSSP
jgi:hypothetical protein